MTGFFCVIVESVHGTEKAMYVIRCKLGETVIVGDTIAITIVETPDESGVARLGIDAPQEMYIRKLAEDLNKNRNPRTID